MRWRTQNSQPPSWYGTSQAQRLGVTWPAADAIVSEIEKRYLGEGAPAPEREKFRQRLHFDDLMLARACARGDETAWEEFWRKYRNRLHLAARALTRESSRAAEMADGLFAELYGLREHEGARVSKLDSYTGIGSLEGWLCALLAQAHVDQWRRERRIVGLDEPKQLVRHLTSPPPAVGESEGAATATRRQLEGALEAVLRNLDAPARLLLNLYFLDAQTLARIAGLLAVHESTVSRRLDRLLAQLRRQTRRELQRRGVPARARDEAMQMDPRWLQVDVHKWLQPASVGRNQGSSRSV